MQNNLILQRHHRCWGHWLYFKDVVTLSGSHKDVGWSTALNRCDLLALPLSLFHKLALSRWQMSCHPQPEEACLRKDNRNRVCHFPLIIYTDGLFLLLLARLFQLCLWLSYGWCWKFYTQNTRMPPHPASQHTLMANNNHSSFPLSL